MQNPSYTYRYTYDMWLGLSISSKTKVRRTVVRYIQVRLTAAHVLQKWVILEDENELIEILEKLVTIATVAVQWNPDPKLTDWGSTCILNNNKHHVPLGTLAEPT